MLLLLGCHAALRLWAWNVGHIWHLSDWALGATTAHIVVEASATLEVALWVLCVLVLTLGFFITIESHQLLTEVRVLHSKLLADLNEASQAVNIILVLLVDLFVDLESLVEEIHSSVAAGDHEAPFDFLGLDLAGALEEEDSLLKHVLLGVVHTQAGDHVNLGRVVSVTFLVVVDGLEFILLLLIKVAHLGEDFRV